VIRLLLEPPRFECETAQDAADLARLMGIKAATAPEFSVCTPLSVGPVTVKAPTVTATSAGHPQGRMKPTGRSKPCKKCKRPFPIVDRTDCAAVYCKACRPKPVGMHARGADAKAAAKSRPVKVSTATVRACAAKGCSTMFEAVRPEIVHCEEHRLGVGQNRESVGKPIAVKAPIPEAGKPSGGPLTFPVVTCQNPQCGASVPRFETIDGLCLDCAPMRRKAS